MLASEDLGARRRFLLLSCLPLRICSFMRSQSHLSLGPSLNLPKESGYEPSRFGGIVGYSNPGEQSQRWLYGDEC